MKNFLRSNQLIIVLIAVLILFFYDLFIVEKPLTPVQPGVATLRGAAFCRLEKGTWVKVEKPKENEYEAICGNFLLKNSPTDLSISVYKDKKLVDYFEGTYEEGDVVFDIRDDYPAGKYKLNISHFRQTYQRVTLEVFE